MKQIVQCPDCKALKFRKQNYACETFWSPLGEDEQIAFDVILSSPALQVIAGQVQVIAELCPTCYAKQCN